MTELELETRPLVGLANRASYLPEWERIQQHEDLKHLKLLNIILMQHDVPAT